MDGTTIHAAALCTIPQTLAAARRGLDLPESAAADIAVAAYTKKLAAMAPDGKIPTEAQV